MLFQICSKNHVLAVWGRLAGGGKIKQTILISTVPSLLLFGTKDIISISKQKLHLTGTYFRKDI